MFIIWVNVWEKGLGEGLCDVCMHVNTLSL